MVSHKIIFNSRYRIKNIDYFLFFTKIGLTSKYKNQRNFEKIEFYAKSLYNVLILSFPLLRYEKCST